MVKNYTHAVRICRHKYDYWYGMIIGPKKNAALQKYNKIKIDLKKNVLRLKNEYYLTDDTAFIWHETSKKSQRLICGWQRLQAMAPVQFQIGRPQFPCHSLQLCVKKSK